jgi:hypothetical protein
MALPALMLVVALQAQNPVESTHIDEKYAYTTVVYKNKAANDQDVLSALESEFSIGDVVRVTLAPPPLATPAATPIAASEPVYADKNRGEDTWLPETAATRPELTAAVSGTLPAQKLNTERLASKAAGLPLTPQNLAVAAPPALKNTAAETNVAMETSAPAAAKEKTAVKATKSGKGKAVKKSGKKSGYKPKLKTRKRGKQGYACPRF